MKFKNPLKYLFKVLFKFIKFVKIEYYEYKNPFKERYKLLTKTYKFCNLNRDRNYYVNKLNKSLTALGYPKYNETIGMYSEHLIIFTAIADKNHSIKNILEIGTFEGKTASILAELFPDSKITTIDLPDKDPNFVNTYSRSKNYEIFIRDRNNLISSFKNINFIQLNSLKLSLIKQINLPKQDLIWVDGSHGYPVVASDITNAIGLMHKNSILMCDDIWKQIKSNDSIYNSIAGFETLSEFSKAKIIKTHYFRKRIGKIYNFVEKYISFSKLVFTDQ